MKTLFLTLSKKPFEVMVTGEKQKEFRNGYSDWIMSRLLTPNGTKKDYDVVKFVNGYGKDKPYFIAKYNGFNRAKSESEVSYSNGLNVIIKEYDFIINLGEIIEKGNLK